MKMHPRYMIVFEARHELTEFLTEWSETHKLTPCEELSVFVAMMETTLRRGINSERQATPPDNLQE